MVFCWVSSLANLFLRTSTISDLVAFSNYFPLYFTKESLGVSQMDLLLHSNFAFREISHFSKKPFECNIMKKIRIRLFHFYVFITINTLGLKWLSGLLLPFRSCDNIHSIIFIIGWFYLSV